MEKNKNKILTISIIVSLVLLTGVAALVYLTTRAEVPEGVLRVETSEEVISIDTSLVKLHPVEGILINGKGEEREIDASGVELMELLSDNGITVPSGIKVTADDGYNAEVTVQEMEETGRVYLLMEDGERPQLVVFGDSDSKRNVTGVIMVVVQ
ncbi:MAG: hypothetical protein IJ955_03270 [Oscillospiraceae bacterium]|nr:hypothetical protein [Oscillospiraceae bacterium]